MNNHGKVGEAKYIKMTNEEFQKRAKKPTNFKDGYKIDIVELWDFRIYSSIPIIIDESTQGIYEVVCKYGVEIH